MRNDKKYVITYTLLVDQSVLVKRGKQILMYDTKSHFDRHWKCMQVLDQAIEVTLDDLADHYKIHASD